MPEITLREMAKRVAGTVVGDPDAKINHIAGLAEAGPGALSFLTNARYENLLRSTRATAAIVDRQPRQSSCSLIQTDNPDLAFAVAAALFLPPPPRFPPGIHPSAVIAPNATIGEGAAVGAMAVIGEEAVIGPRTVVHPRAIIGPQVRIGPDCIIYPGAVLYHRVQLGARVIIHANAVIGSDGFGYAWDGRQHVKIPQLGTVEIGDDVEIGACTVIARGRFGKTEIGSGTKLDSLIQIAHNVRIGAHCAFAAQVGVSGSTIFGNGVLVGGQAGFVGHIHIGDRARVSAKAGVTKDVPTAAHVTGYPARLHEMQIEEWRHLKALPRLRRTVEALEKAQADEKTRRRQKAKRSSAADRAPQDGRTQA